MTMVNREPSNLVGAFIYELLFLPADSTAFFLTSHKTVIRVGT